MLECESTELPDDVSEAEEVRSVRDAEVPRTGKGILFQNGVDEERLARFLHRVLDDPRMVEVRMVLQEAPELQDLLTRLLQRRADIVSAVHRLNRAPAQPCDRSRRLDRQLPDLVFLVQPALDLGDDVIEILHGARMTHPVI